MQKRFEALQAEVEKRDHDIRQLQRSLKEIESILVSFTSNNVGYCIFHWVLECEVLTGIFEWLVAAYDAIDFAKWPFEYFL